MNKTELIAKVSESVGIDKSDTAAIIDQAFIEMEEVLARDEEVVIRGFFKLFNKTRQTTIRRDINKGEMVRVAAHKYPYCRISHSLRDQIKELNPVKDDKRKYHKYLKK